MNLTPVRDAMERWIDREAPNVHLEVLLLFGECPREINEELACRRWGTDMRKYIRDRYCKKTTCWSCSGACTGIIMDRIAEEVNHES